MTTAETATVIAICTGLVTLITAIIGVRERMEHINTRISAQQKETQQSLIEMETFLVKTTAFERRRSRD